VQSALSFLALFLYLFKKKTAQLTNAVTVLALCCIFFVSNLLMILKAVRDIVIGF